MPDGDVLKPAPAKFVMRLDGTGGAQEIAGSGTDSAGGQAHEWVHLDWAAPGTLETLIDDFSVAPELALTLLAEETRPRSLSVKDAQEVLLLRGVNLAEGEDPTDMISLRLLVGHNRIISLSKRRLLTLDTIRQSLENGTGPEDCGALVAAMVEILISYAEATIGDLGDQLDDLEDLLLVEEVTEIEENLRPIRQKLITLHRYLVPQRDALSRFAATKAPWMAGDLPVRVRNALDRLLRVLEDMGAYRDRGALVQEELTHRAAQQLSRNTFVLTAAAGVLLPLTFLTGLFGMNVGGIPFKDWGLGFATMSLVCCAFGGIAWLIGKRLRLW